MKISVIVPVYNTIKYLEKCVESVIAQTYANWEMIMIDDGSSDGSELLVDQLAKRDERIVVYHQKNAGPGKTRNFGLSMATGDFVVFLDSDDYIDDKYFELLANRGSKCDVVFVDVNQVDENGKILRCEHMSRYQSYSKEKFICAQMTGKIPWGGVRKAVNISLIRENDLKYTEFDIGEEALYSFRLLEAARSIDFLTEKAVYYYVNHNGSQSKKRLLDPWGPVVKTIKEYILNQNIYNKYSKTINAFNIVATIVSLDKIECFCDKEIKDNLIKLRVSEFLNTYDRNCGIDFSSMHYKALLFTPFLCKGVVWPILLASKVRRIF